MSVKVPPLGSRRNVFLKEKRIITPTKIVYLVIGSNNFWYAIEDTLAQAKKTKSVVLNDEELFGDPESDYTPEKPKKVYIYKSVEII